MSELLGLLARALLYGHRNIFNVSFCLCGHSAQQGPEPLNPSTSRESQAVVSPSFSNSEYLVNIPIVDTPSRYNNNSQQHIPASPPPSYSPRCPVSTAVSTTDSEDNQNASSSTSNLRGIYCPDLLHACSLILPSQQYEDHSQRDSIGRSLSLSSVEYAEIDEICEGFSRIEANERPAATIRTASNQQEGCLENSFDQAMGQNLSLRRPRISLTWVLREQQQTNATESTDNNSKTVTEKKKVKSKYRDEKLFSEKYVSDHNLQEYQKKREPSKDLLFVCTPQKHNTVSCDGVGRRRSNFKLNENIYQKCDEPVDDAKSLKGTYSEPSLIAASEGNQRRHRHRKRRDRNRMQKFGYEIRNVDDFLSKCSLASPGNIPVVLSASSTLYQTRPGGYQIEIPLPLGMVVNAVFKNQNWLYVQTPHAEEGYVGYSSCLPLGILPPAARTTSTSRPTPCWETNGDVFPRPCGNMTDSEKEIRLRGGTRSDGARTPRLRRNAVKAYGEHHVDKLYLRAASQPKLTEKAYAQLKPTNSYASSKCTNDEYVLLQPKAKVVQKHHLNTDQQSNRNLRQTLLAITHDYSNECVGVRKGDIVTLLECRESKDMRQWFYVRSREGREGFIPAEVAGHGFL